MSVFITSAAAEIYHEEIWDPVGLVGHFSSRIVVAIAMFTIVIATLSVNIAANVVSPANDLANLAPKKISFRTGGLITGVVGVLMIPWKYADNPNSFIYHWLVGYSGGLASIAGVLIADYWLVREKHLVLSDLYRKDGVYRYGKAGTNWHAILATVVGCSLAWIGLSVPPLRPMFDYAWFIGGGAAMFVYWAAMKLAPPTRLRESLSSYEVA